MTKDGYMTADETIAALLDSDGRRYVGEGQYYCIVKSNDNEYYVDGYDGIEHDYINMAFGVDVTKQTHEDGA